MAGKEGASSEAKGGEASTPPVKSKRRKAKAQAAKLKRTRIPRIYPALSFEESLVIADAIQTYASGEKVARLTLLKQMNLSPTSSATQILITSSGKYGITKGSYAAEHLELTPEGKIATDKNAPIRAKTETRFSLAIKGIAPFDVLYSRYRGKKLPSHDVLKDVLKEANLEVSDEKECIDTFVVNTKFLGLLQTIAGSETLVPIETLIEQLPESLADPDSTRGGSARLSEQLLVLGAESSARSPGQWHKICFYILSRT